MLNGDGFIAGWATGGVGMTHRVAMNFKSEESMTDVHLPCMVPTVQASDSGEIGTVAKSLSESYVDLPQPTSPVDTPSSADVRNAPDIETFATGKGLPKAGILQRSTAWSLATGAYWQWEHKTGFRNYRERDQAKIEKAFQRGESKVRIKTGKLGKTPMEIFFVSMAQFDPTTKNLRRVRRCGQYGWWMHVRRLVMEVYCAWATGETYRESFQHYQARREAFSAADFASARSQTIIPEVQCSERDRYSEQGICARIANSRAFFVLCMSAVFLNAIWIGIETDLNDSQRLYESKIHFVVAEQVFCVIFVAECWIRFMAFETKRDCLKEAWFRFDLVLVVLMVLETWFISPFLSSSNLRNLTLLRLARLLRLSRMTRLLRCVPEVMAMLKGMVAALRSVCLTLCLLLVILYVFGIYFRTTSVAADGASEMIKGRFGSVLVSMRSLLLYGVFMDSTGSFVERVWEELGQFPGLMLILFVFLSSYTVMNMLIGILCEVVSGVTQEETQKSELLTLRSGLMDILECYDADGDNSIGKEEFQMFMQNPEVREALTKFGTDVQGLVSLSEVIFQEEGTLGFEELLNVVMRVRGAHTSRVTDIVELREYLRLKLNRIESKLLHEQKGLFEEISRGLTASRDPIAGVATVTGGGVLSDGGGSSSGLTDVRLLLPGGKTKVRRHSTRTTIAQVLSQVSSKYGQLRATDSAGVEYDAELTLGKLASECAIGPIDLTVVHHIT